MVPKAGLEPARRVTTLDFESSASANSATSAIAAVQDILRQTTIIYYHICTIVSTIFTFYAEQILLNYNAHQ